MQNDFNVYYMHIERHKHTRNLIEIDDKALEVSDPAVWIDHIFIQMDSNVYMFIFNAYIRHKHRHTSRNW